MEKTTLSNITNKIQALSKTEQIEVKGGLLLYCEEKRRTFLGISYTSMEWKLANDGSLLLSIKM